MSCLLYYVGYFFCGCLLLFLFPWLGTSGFTLICFVVLFLLIPGQLK